MIPGAWGVPQTFMSCPPGGPRAVKTLAHGVGMLHRTDIVIVGAGILGLATAYRAHRAGVRVSVIDSAAAPVGASIQNFGHACFTGQADAYQELTRSSAEGWVSAAAEAGFWASRPGTVVAAATDLEFHVLKEFAEHRGPREVVLLNAETTRDALGNRDADVVGGALLPSDMRVDPREAAPALARWLAQDGVEFRFNERVLATHDGEVHTTRGIHRADHVVVTPGLGVLDAFPGVAEWHGVRTCTLAMTMIERPEAHPADTTVLTGTSLTRYGGFTAMPSAGQLREELATRDPELVGCRANLMMTGTPGGLIIGDSHHYERTPAPFINEDTTEILLHRATTLLGISRPRILQRWLGRYADAPGTDLILERPDPRTTLAVVTSGIGMTLSFGVAERILADDSAFPLASSATPHPFQGHSVAMAHT